jgi:hypothetical protein
MDNSLGIYTLDSISGKPKACHYNPLTVNFNHAGQYFTLTVGFMIDDGKPLFFRALHEPGNAKSCEVYRDDLGVRSIAEIKTWCDRYGFDINEDLYFGLSYCSSPPKLIR